MSPTLIFYLCVEFIAVSLLACADSMVSSSKRNFIQSDEGKFSFYRKFDIRAYHLCFVMSFLVLFLVLALRDHVGTDYGSYINIYRNINSYGILSRWGEIGFSILCRLLGILVPGTYELMFAVMAFLTMYFLYKSICKMSCCWYLSLYIYISTGFFHNSMNQIRQALSMMIIIYAFYFLFDHKDRKFFLLYVILAGLIHQSAYFIMLFYPFYKVQMTRKNLLIYAFILVSLNFPFVKNAILYVVSFTKYEHYVNSTKGEVLQTTIANTYLRLCMLIGCLLFYKKTILRNPNAVIFYNSAVICLIVTRIATITTVPIFARLSSYFFMTYMFLVPEVLKSMKNMCLTIYSRKFYVLLTILLYLAYFLVRYFMTDYTIVSVGSYRMMFFS